MDIQIPLRVREELLYGVIRQAYPIKPGYDTDGYNRLTQDRVDWLIRYLRNEAPQFITVDIPEFPKLDRPTEDEIDAAWDRRIANEM